MNGAATVSLVCPKCDRQNQYAVNFGVNDFVCPSCKKPFQSLIATVRGKRSRGDKKNGRREYSIRVMINSQEELIEYINNDYYDFEMRSRDLVAFLYRKDQLYIVHNLTIGQYQRIRKPLNIVAIAIFVLVVVAVFLVVRMSKG